MNISVSKPYLHSQQGQSQRDYFFEKPVFLQVCLCMYVLFPIFVETNFVDFDELCGVMTCVGNH